MADEPQEEPPPLPPWAFAKGALIGFVLGVPMIASAVFVTAHLGLGNPSRSFGEVLRFAVLFTGVPAVLTAGGVARVAIRAALTPQGRRPIRAVVSGAASFAAAGAGLALLCAIPLGDLPLRSLPFLGFALAGAIAGAAVGAVIGLWAGSR